MPKLRQLFQKRPFVKFATLGLIAFGLMSLTLAASKSERLLRTKVEKPAPSTTRRVGPPDQSQSKASRPVKSGYVRRAALQPRLRDALGVMGQRLEDEGKERVMLNGTLRVGGQGQPLFVQVIRELADKIQVERRGDVKRSSLNFNGQRTAKVGEVSGIPDESLLETLVNDSAEHFFAGQAQGLATRFLGFRFRLDDGTDENYTGPFYDVYQVDDQVRIGGDLQQRSKLYHFNSDTRLLERVRYQIERGGVPIDIEVVLGDWQMVQGEMVPRQITRVEAGVTAFTLNVESIGIGPHAEDGLFSSTDKK
jgi:hypothetical protein